MSYNFLKVCHDIESESYKESFFRLLGKLSQDEMDELVGKYYYQNQKFRDVMDLDILANMAMDGEFTEEFESILLGASEDVIKGLYLNKDSIEGLEDALNKSLAIQVENEVTNENNPAT